MRQRPARARARRPPSRTSAATAKERARAANRTDWKRAEGGEWGDLHRFPPHARTATWGSPHHGEKNVRRIISRTLALHVASRVASMAAWRETAGLRLRLRLRLPAGRLLAQNFSLCTYSRAGTRQVRGRGHGLRHPGCGLVCLLSTVPQLFSVVLFVGRCASVLGVGVSVVVLVGRVGVTRHTAPAMTCRGHAC